MKLQVKSYTNLIGRLQSRLNLNQAELAQEFGIPHPYQIISLGQKCLDVKGQSVEKWEAEIGDRVAYL
jgi:hypothetical protein